MFLDDSPLDAPLADVVQDLARSPLLTGLARPALLALAEHTRSANVAVGDRFFNPSQPSRELFLLAEGRAGAFNGAEEGQRVMVALFSAPAVFGEMELVAGLPRLEYVEALDPCRVLIIDGEAFLALLRADNRVCFSLLANVCRRLCIATDHGRSLAFDNAETRLAGLFLSFCEAYPPRANAARLPVKLTYEQLAQSVGVSVRTVERTMRRWLQEGWLRRTKGWYVVDGRQELVRRARSGSLHLHSHLRDAG